MFNNFVNLALYTEYHLFNKTGCKFTVTNVYFRRENDIILNGTLWKEEQWAPADALGARAARRPAAPGSPAPRRVIYCRNCIHLLYNEK